DNNIYLGGYFFGNQFKINGNIFYQDTGYAVSGFLTHLTSAGIISKVEVIPGGMVWDFDLNAQRDIYIFVKYYHYMNVRQINLTTDTCYSNHCEEYFLAKLNNSNYNCDWAKKYHNDFFWSERRCISTLANGDFYFTGSG